MSVHALPRDLLALIVSYIPPRPRLVVVSRVCRHWRATVLRHLDRLPYTFKELSPQTLPGLVDLLRACPALAVLPNSLDTGSLVPWAELPAWPNITCAELSAPSHTYDAWIARLPNLRHLRFFSVRPLDTPALVPVLCNVTTITLALIEETTMLDAVVLPHLTTFFCESWEWPLQFLATHASQLVQLSLRRGMGAITDLCALICTSTARFFPRLSKLSLQLAPHVDITPILTHSPLLAELHTTVQPALPHIRAAYADKVVRLFRQGLKEAELLAYPNLCSAVLTHVPTARAAPLHTRLRHLCLVLDGRGEPHATVESAAWPALESLSLQITYGDIGLLMAAIVAAWHMPALRHLQLKSDFNSGVCTAHGTSPSAIECILARPERFPSLMRVGFPAFVPEKDAEFIREAALLFPRLQAMGVMRLEFFVSRTGSEAAAEAQLAHPWLSLHYVWL